MNYQEDQPSMRIRKINRLIQEELGKAINEEIELPAGLLITIVGVETSVDIKHAKVRIGVIPKSKTGTALRILERNIFTVQQALNKKLVLHFVPKIRFVIDTVQDKLERVEELLQKAKGE